jgi:hypothetical protein
VANGWTASRRAKQASAIHRWRPWENATGPKTRAGKAKVARNGIKTGAYTAAARAERQSLREILREIEDMSFALTSDLPDAKHNP